MENMTEECDETKSVDRTNQNEKDTHASTTAKLIWKMDQ